MPVDKKNTSDTSNFTNKVGSVEKSIPLEKTIPPEKTGNINPSVLAGNIPEVVTGIGKILGEFQVNQESLIESLSDDFPFLLFPVRTEVRFVTVKTVKRIKKVTVNKVNTSDTRTSSGTGSRTEIPGNTGFTEAKIQAETKTGGIIADVFPDTVDDEKQLWVRIFPDVIEISKHEPKLTQDECNAGEDFWKAIWHKENDKAIQLEQWNILCTKFGINRSMWIAKQTTPANKNDNNAAAPLFGNIDLSPAGSSAPACSYVLPDRFSAILYKRDIKKEYYGKPIPDPLIVGIDFTDNNTTEEPDDSDIPAEIKWLTDFDEAEKIGMAIKIPLDTDFVQGFDKLLILGTKTSADIIQSQKLVEDLFDGHLYGMNGFSFLPQGYATNATGSKNRTIEYDLEASLEIVLNEYSINSFSPVFDKTDGQLFAEFLGISYDNISKAYNFDKKDSAEACEINRALWPATLGYYLTEFISPLIKDNDILKVREFFIQNVTGRGPVSAIKIGSQPYGVLPATAFSKWQYQNSLNANDFSNRLFVNFLSVMLSDFDNLSQDYKSLGKPVPNGKTPDDLFQEILGLNASSVSYSYRLAFGPDFIKAITGTDADITPLINKFKNDLHFLFDVNPNILKLMYTFGNVDPAWNNFKLLIPFIDSNPLSEFEKLRGSFGTAANDMNYIEWLNSNGFESIKNEVFPQGNTVTPDSLFYLLLRHAVLLSYFDTSLDILHTSNLINDRFSKEIELLNVVKDFSVTARDKTIIKSRIDAAPPPTGTTKNAGSGTEQSAPPAHDNITGLKTGQNISWQSAAAAKENITDSLDKVDSKWGILGGNYGNVTSNMAMFDYLDNVIKIDKAGTYSLTEVNNALNVLKELPNARLERLFAEHIDLCSYRLDSWLMGLVIQRILSNRLVNGSRKTGSYIGAFGYLEDVAPGVNPLIIFREILPVKLIPAAQQQPPADAAYTYVYNPVFNTGDSFAYMGKDSSQNFSIDPETNKIRENNSVDPENMGYIHAPSLTQAATAAILRSGYFSHKTVGTDNKMAVNLSSERVRDAMYYIEGVNSGQDLGALLGYRFERLMHDNHLDEFILDLRKKFNFTASNITGNNDFEEPVVYVQNVTNGLKLINDANPFDDLPMLNSGNIDTIKNFVGILKDHMDAIGDLVLSESIYQMTQGNYPKSGSALKTVSEGSGIREPEFIKTPGTGIALTHRVIINIDAAKIDPKKNLTPRSQAEPYLNYWIGSLLGDPDKIIVQYRYITGTGSGQKEVIENMKLADLNIQPIDLIYLYLHDQDENNFDKINNYISNFLKLKKGLNVIEILNENDEQSLQTDETSLNSLETLISSIKELIISSRSLKPADFELPSANINSAYDKHGFNDLSDRLKTLLKSFTDTLTNLISADNLNVPSIIDSVLKLSLLGYDVSSLSLTDTKPDYIKYIIKNLNDKIAAANSQYANALNLVQSNESNSVQDKYSEAIKIFYSIAESLLGSPFLMLINFNLNNSHEISESIGHTKGTLNDFSNGLLSFAGSDCVDPWLQSISKVRSRLNSYSLIRNNYDMLNLNSKSEINLFPVQLPLTHDENIIDSWAGAEYPEDYELNANTLSIVAEFPAAYNPSGIQAGIFVDEWVEYIPNSEEVSGVSFNYNQPDSEPPQTLLLAVAPQNTGTWSWEDLQNCVIETFELAKKRTLSPENIWLDPAGNFYQVLPAVIAASSYNAGDSSTITIDFNKIFKNAS
jgi:hypothetical protein